jgi:hypothetical protein
MTYYCSNEQDRQMHVMSFWLGILAGAEFALQHIQKFILGAVPLNCQIATT